MQAIGEVLSASITDVVAACWQEADGGNSAAPPVVPRFGSFIKIDSTEQALQIIAVVYDVTTGPQDSLHKPVAMRMSREQLRVQQPQIFALLQTQINCAVVGYAHRGQYHCSLPPLPAQVHDFVYQASADELARVTDNLDFVRLITRVTSSPNDELVIAAIHEAASARKNKYDFLVQSGRALAQAFGDDYSRLSAALTKLNSRLL
jgi:hypothetical protein